MHRSTEADAEFRSNLAEKLSAILSAHLHDQEIGPDDDFYAMGGDSLIALRIVAAAQEQGIVMTLRDLLFYPTVRELTEYLSSESSGGATGDSTRAADADAQLDLLSASDRALVPEAVAVALPVSALQLGIIYLCETSGDPELYHSVIGWEVVARFDEDLFQEALGELCQRHAALRTSFDLGAYSEAVQLQWSEVTLPLTVDHLPSNDTEKARALIRERNAHGQSLPIDWSRAPLFRCHVLVQPDSFHVSLATHHAIIDGWSYGRLIVDLLTLYHAKLRGEKADLPEPPRSGEAEFVRAERTILASQEASDFWHRQADAPALLFDRGQFSGAANANESVEFALSVDLLDGLRTTARYAGVSLKALALAAHARALAAWTDRDGDVVTGVVVNTRAEHAGSDLAVGLYLNTVPLRFSTVSGPWTEVARSALTLERSATPYRAYPLAQIESRLGRPPFDAVFNFMNFHVYQDLEALPDLDTRSWWVRGKPSFPFRVDFEVDSAEKGSRVVIAYDPALLPEQQVSTYAQCYEELLHSAAGGAR